MQIKPDPYSTNGHDCQDARDLAVRTFSCVVDLLGWRFCIHYVCALRPSGPIRVIVGTGPDIDRRVALLAIETATLHKASALHCLIGLTAISAGKDDLDRGDLFLHWPAPGSQVSCSIAEVVWNMDVACLSCAHAQGF